MVNLITTNAEGHKVGLRITNREQYFEVRNTAANRENFEKARAGDDNAKRRLVQFNYNDQLPDGVLAGCHTAASTFAIDIDCGDREECLKLAQQILSMSDRLRLLELSTSARWGLHAVCWRQLGKTILENQIEFAMLTHTEMDCNAHDQQRVMFTGPADEDTLLFLDDRIFEEPMTAEEGAQEYARLKEREEQGLEELPAGYKKGEKHYRPWEAQSVAPDAQEKATDTPDSTLPQPMAADDLKARTTVFGHPVADYINALYPQGAPRGQRHNTMLKLSNDLLVLLDNDANLVQQTLLQLPWVQEVVRERGEKELNNVIDSSMKQLKKRESENFYPPKPSKMMQQAIASVTLHSYKELQAEAQHQSVDATTQNDILTVLENLGRQLKRLFSKFPLLQLLCHGLKPKHYAAAMFLGGAFGMTLMTCCWYLFWASGNKKCRLNCILELIGRFGSGKHIAVDLYKLMMEPIRKADAPQVAALNKWNEEQQRRGANKDKSARPNGIYRCLPPESSTAAIREAEFNAFEVIDGEKWPLHVFIFDSELENTLLQKNKTHMDQIMTLWLKGFHNEPHGTFLKTTSSMVGEYDVHFNCVYTGTEYSLKKQVNSNTYGTGLHTRITPTAMGDTNYEMMEKKKPTPETEQCEQQIRDWAYLLDKTKGEIPCEPISDALHSWTARRMADAKDENSKVMEDLLKRPCWHAINYSLPYIVARHWDKMVLDEKDGRWKCGPDFKTDKYDRELALLIANAQYAFQLHFFGSIGEEYYEHNDISSTSTHRLMAKTQLCFSRLPQVFSSDDVRVAFELTSKGSVTSRLSRLQADGLIQRIRSGEHKGMYRKLV